MRRDIKHYIINFEGKNRYLCNRAVKPTKEKSTNNWKKVTCLNCKESKQGYINSIKFNRSSLKFK